MGRRSSYQAAMMMSTLFAMMDDGVEIRQPKPFKIESTGNKSKSTKLKKKKVKNFFVYQKKEK